MDEEAELRRRLRSAAGPAPDPKPALDALRARLDEGPSSGPLAPSRPSPSLSPRRARVLVVAAVLAAVAAGVGVVATRDRPTTISTSGQPDPTTTDASATEPTPTLPVAPTTTTRPMPRPTITVGTQSCGTVDRPTAGELAVPAPGGGDRLEATITWSNSFILDPPPPEAEPGVPLTEVETNGYGTPAITKLAVLTDPLHRPLFGDGRLVWATFYPQTLSFSLGGPFGPRGGPTTTTAPDAPCAMAMQATDATTGEQYGLTNIG